jgi:acetyl esterase/lipase
MRELTDIYYKPTANAAHTFDLYELPLEGGRSNKRPLVCFVHGGAWRSLVCPLVCTAALAHRSVHSEDKNDHAELARRLCARTGWAVAVPNYRLTSAVSPLRHPGHAEDILAFLNFVRDAYEPVATERPYDRDRIYLIGHSCSAHMLASIFLESPHPSLKPSSELLHAVRGVVCSEGIYDVDMLLSSFPSYRGWFIAAAFDDRTSYADDAVSKYHCRDGGAHIRWCILHSAADTLVDVLQSRIMHDHLLSLAGGDSAKVHMDFDTLDREHNDNLQSDEYVRVVADFFRA